MLLQALDACISGRKLSGSQERVLREMTSKFAYDKTYKNLAILIIVSKATKMHNQQIDYDSFGEVDSSLVEEWVKDEENSGVDPGFYDDYDPQSTKGVLPKGRQAGGYNPTTSLMDNISRARS